MSSAAERFICTCCKEPHEESEASFDQQLDGPVCEDCRKSFIKALAWLKTADIRRPMVQSDINNFNCNRFKQK